MRKSLGILIFSCILFSCKKDSSVSNSDEPYIPSWIFGHWVWEGEGTTASAKQLADDYIANGIPVDAINIDSPWSTDFNTFSWDPSRYPDAQGMIDYFHSKNIKIICWVTGVVDTNVHPLYDSLAAKKCFMQYGPNSAPAVIQWWKGDGSLFDFWNPETVKFLHEAMGRMLDMGIDGWKCDGTDYYELFSQYSTGAGKNIARIDYSNEYYQFFSDYSKEKRGKDALVMARPIDNYGITPASGDLVAFAPRNLIFAGWVGDQDATFEGMHNALNNMFHSSEYGYLIFGSDVGGYRGDDNYPLKRSKELFIRWAQLGAFCGLMENGGGGEHRPWIFDLQTDSIYKNLVLLREQMIPYLVKSAKAAFSIHKSLMQFENDNNYQYLLGNDIFVAPIINKDGNVNVQFPAGDQWIYLYDKSKEYDGGSTASLTLPLNEFSVFIRKGSDLVNTLNP